LFSVDFEGVAALSEVLLLPEEGRVFAEALIDFFESNSNTEKLIEWAITKEIETNSKFINIQNFFSFSKLAF
jgi:hypothetical protein